MPAWDPHNVAKKGDTVVILARTSRQRDLSRYVGKVLGGTTMQSDRGKATAQQVRLHLWEGEAARISGGYSYSLVCADRPVHGDQIKCLMMGVVQRGHLHVQDKREPMYLVYSVMGYTDAELRRRLGRVPAEGRWTPSDVDRLSDTARGRKRPPAARAPSPRPAARVRTRQPTPRVRTPSPLRHPSTTRPRPTRSRRSPSRGPTVTVTYGKEKKTFSLSALAAAMRNNEPKKLASQDWCYLPWRGRRNGLYLVGTDARKLRENPPKEVELVDASKTMPGYVRVRTLARDTLDRFVVEPSVKLVAPDGYVAYVVRSDLRRALTGKQQTDNQGRQYRYLPKLHGYIECDTIATIRRSPYQTFNLVDVTRSARQAKNVKRNKRGIVMSQQKPQYALNKRWKDYLPQTEVILGDVLKKKNVPWDKVKAALKAAGRPIPTRDQLLMYAKVSAKLTAKGVVYTTASAAKLGVVAANAYVDQANYDSMGIAGLWLNVQHAAAFDVLLEKVSNKQMEVLKTISSW